MSVLFLDGMDHYNLTQAPAKWDLGVSMLYNSAFGRFGGGSLYYDASNFEKSATKSIPTTTSFIVNYAMRVGVLQPSSLTSMFRLLDSGTVQTELRFGPLGQIAVFTNGSQVAVSANGLISLSVWNHIEWKVTISASTGAGQCVVRLNNVEIINVTGISTKTSSNASANSVSIGRLVSTQNDFRYDDFTLMDSSGSGNNDLIGDVRIETLYPSGAGAHTVFTPNGAGTNWGCVNENPADDDTTFVSSNNVGDIDTYAFTNPVGTPTTVFAIQANMRARKDNAGTRTFGRVIRISGTDYVGSGFSLSTDYALYREIIELNPNTAVAWTASDITALEAGAKVLT